MLSPVRLSAFGAFYYILCCNVRAVCAPYSGEWGDWNFPQCFCAIWYVGHLLTSR